MAINNNNLISSANIKIYPASNRDPATDPLARLNIEQNLIKVNNNVTDYNNYVVNGLGLSRLENQFTLNSGECVINGYNIELTTSETFTITPSNNIYYIYFQLNMQNKTATLNDTSYVIKELNSADTNGNDGYFNGLKLIYRTSELTDGSYLLLGKVVYNNGWQNIDLGIREGKINANKTVINIDGSFTGISKDTTAKSTYLVDFLKNDFIIDDGTL